MTEQELYNEYRKSDCKSFTDFLINKIAELEKRLVFTRAEFQRQYKENAELKENNNHKACVKLAHQANVARDNLDQAKELLNEFMRISKASDEDFEHDYSELIGEAEQFIKDLEK